MHNRSNPNDLSEEEKKEIKKAIHPFGSSIIEPEKVFDSFNEWQSPKTRSLKRFTISLSVLLSIAFIIKMDITDVEPLGLKFVNADETVFLFSLLAIHIGIYFYYIYQKALDINIKKAKVCYLQEELDELIKLSDYIEQFLADGRSNSVKSLVQESFGKVTFTDHQLKALEVFEEVMFFKINLKKEKVKYDWGEKVESFLLLGLFLLASISILYSFNGT